MKKCLRITGASLFVIGFGIIFAGLAIIAGV